ncbi:uncharacterized protein LOC132713705 [Ruditapes philippinarum]|uniref:uncharacterized protein LOC132713705 n=1 Tax=Ruditapes philippinarum TaxID=129788 RepID=UPI00295AA333|nr:uncharacterized protein LOC132713705 [Ruditapes philippinarum]
MSRNAYIFAEDIAETISSHEEVKAPRMETDISKNTKWRLKKVNKVWFLDIGGKLKWLDILDKAIEVVMEENIIFADDLMYQVSEESDGEVIITEIKSINKKDKTSGFKQDDQVFQTEIDIKLKTREEDIKYIKESPGTSIEGDSVQDIAFMRQTEAQNDEFRSFADGLAKNEGGGNSSDKEEMVNNDNGSEEYVERNDGLVKNEGEENSSDNKEMVNNDNGSEEYVERKGKIRGFFKRMKQIIKKKPANTKYGDPVYDFVQNAFEEGSCDSISDEDVENEEEICIDREDDELSFDPGDIITNIDPVDEDLRMETTANAANGQFPTKYVKVCEKSYSKVTEL